MGGTSFITVIQFGRALDQEVYSSLKTFELHGNLMVY